MKLADLEYRAAWIAFFVLLAVIVFVVVAMKAGV